MQKTSLFIIISALGMALNINAQTTTDTIRNEVRSYVARNFSEARTFNLYWETSPKHNYSLKQNGKKNRRWQNE